MPNNTIAMEEHYDAYFTWKHQGIKGAWCWHVDAHLDVGRLGLWEERLEALKPCTSFAQAQALGITGSSYLPWGGLNCGNYLYPAIKEGIVGKLTWVIPPDLPHGNYLRWAREHLDSWFGIGLDEYAGLTEQEGRVSGTILGIPFEMGVLEALEIPKEPVLLDLDIDYFLDGDGEKWQDSRVFAEKIEGLESLCTTVAYSVLGGYTPTQDRELAAPFLSGDLSGYEANTLDEATVLLRCRKFEQAQVALEKILGQYPVIAGFSLGSCFQGLKQPEQALAAWQKVLKEADLPADGRAYVGCACAEVLVELQRPKEALDHVLAAKSLVPPDYRYVWTEALAREALGEDRRATRMVRTALKMAEGNLFSLKIMWVLSRLYRKQGKDELAKMELRKLRTHDVTGDFRTRTLLVN